MLARNGSAHGAHLGEELANALLKAVAVPVGVRHVAFDDVDVQVSVAGVAVADRFKAVLGADALDGAQQIGQFGPWNHRVLFFIDAVLFDGLTDAAAQLPQRVALSLGLGKKYLEGARLFGHGGQLFGLAEHGFFVGSVDFHEQVSCDAGSGRNRHSVNVAQGPVDGVAFHELESARRDSGLKNARHRGAGHFS